MAKDRTGLQSKISQIFAGVPVPKKGRSRSKSRDSKPKSDSDDHSKPAALEQTVPQPTVPEPTIPESTAPEPTVQEPVVAEPTAPEPAAQEPIVAEPTALEPAAPQPRTIEEPELQQPVELLQEESSAKVLEAEVPERVIRQIPSKVSRHRKDKLIGPKAAVRPRRQTTALILVVVLSIVLVLVLVRPFGPSRRNTTRYSVAGRTKVKTPIEANIDFNIDWPVPPVYPTDLRDPMEMGSRQVKIEKLELVVRGISYSEDRRYAVIGTQTVQEGDEILGATVVKINQNSVEFEKDGKRWTQEVEGEEK